MVFCLALQKWVCAFAAALISNKEASAYNDWWPEEVQIFNALVSDKASDQFAQSPDSGRTEAHSRLPAVSLLLYTYRTSGYALKCGVGFTVDFHFCTQTL